MTTLDHAAYLERLSRLSPRQRQVAESLVRGERIEDIADVMGVEVDTVRNHIKLLSQRLGLETSARPAITAFLVLGIRP